MLQRLVGQTFLLVRRLSLRISFLKFLLNPAWFKAIAIACFRFVTFLPEPLFNLPAANLCISTLTASLGLLGNGIVHFLFVQSHRLLRRH